MKSSEIIGMIPGAVSADEIAQSMESTLSLYRLMNPLCGTLAFATLQKGDRYHGCVIYDTPEARRQLRNQADVLGLDVIEIVSEDDQ